MTTINTDVSAFEAWLEKNGLKQEQHQKDAVAWCLEREQAETGKGGIIADEMGLGKTIEILGTMHCNPQGSTLIVVPYSLLEQWTQIIAKLCGRPPHVFHGSQRDCVNADHLLGYPIVLTTYGLLTVVETRNPLRRVRWSRIVYDEAHHLRNKHAYVYLHALYNMRADITWLMTGTPIQNSTSDVYSLLSLIGIRNELQTDLSDLIKKYMLRRTKAMVGITLPACHESVIEVAWTSAAEQKMSEDIHSHLSFSNIALQDHARKAPLRNSTWNDGNMKRALVLLGLARKICVLPALLAPKLPNVLVDGEVLPPSAKQLQAAAGVPYASKLNAVVGEVVKRQDNGRPKLIFCYFHREIDELTRLLTDAGLYVKKFDGRTPKNERKLLLKVPCEVLIGQIDATNEGLNLQAYKEVYIVTPHWNPAVEDQAVARCHRIGQTEEVEVFRFVMTGFAGYEALKTAPKAITLDERAREVQDMKRKIVERILTPAPDQDKAHAQTKAQAKEAQAQAKAQEAPAPAIATKRKIKFVFSE